MSSELRVRVEVEVEGLLNGDLGWLGAWERDGG